MTTERIITHSQKDEDGDITAIGKPSEYWSPVSKAEAIKQIENNTYVYYSQNPTCTTRSKIGVINDSTKGKYLRTVADGDPKNNLDNLPNL